MKLELRNYLPCDWRLKLSPKGIFLIAPSQAAAESFLEIEIEALIHSANRIYTAIQIIWPDCKSPLTISPRIMASDFYSSSSRRLKSNEFSPMKTTPPIRSQIDLDWNMIQMGNNPVYVSHLQSQHNLFLNNAAVLAQSAKPPAEFLSATAHVLNFEDELQMRCNHLWRDGQLIEYEYKALRWFHDLETNGWVRRRMQFVSNFYRVTYLGQDCWLGEVLSAVALNQFVDN